jgi:sulfopyruvate decarboxylase TPP-binding subunit
MSPEQSQALLRQEISAQSPVGTALLVLLEQAELTAYRQTARASDALSLARLNGRAEGINSIQTLITPTQDGARPGRQTPA